MLGNARRMWSHVNRNVVCESKEGRKFWLEIVWSKEKGESDTCIVGMRFFLELKSFKLNDICEVTKLR